jgi:hypothetical protein
MSEAPRHEHVSLVLRRDQSLVGLPLPDGEAELVRYSTDEEEVEAGVGGNERALDLAGVWSDLDWDETAEALDRIRHESPPTPPIEL